jgi:allophanate hydrolase subunit 2
VPTGHGSFDEFAAASWEVTSAARSGVRLRTAVVRAPRESIASQPMVPGAVQLAPSGEAIVLGPDGALTGGYPVVCVVASVDADRVSILRPGDDVAFAPVGVDEAARAYRARMTEARRAVVHPTDLR